MLNRSLFEDMIVAHRIKRTPGAAAKMQRHHRLMIERTRETAHRLGRNDFVEEIRPPPPRSEHKALEAEFARPRQWTGKTIEELVRAVEDGSNRPATPAPDPRLRLRDEQRASSPQRPRTQRRIRGSPRSPDIHDGSGIRERQGSARERILLVHEPDELVVAGPALEALHVLFAHHAGKHENRSRQSNEDPLRETIVDAVASADAAEPRRATFRRRSIARAWDSAAIKR